MDRKNSTWTTQVGAMVSLTAENRHTRKGKAILVRAWGTGRGGELTFTKHCPCVRQGTRHPVSFSHFNTCEVSLFSTYNL